MRNCRVGRSYVIINYFAFSVLGACIGTPLTNYLPTGPLLIPFFALSNFFMFNVGWRFNSVKMRHPPIEGAMTQDNCVAFLWGSWAA